MNCKYPLSYLTLEERLPTNQPTRAWEDRAVFDLSCGQDSAAVDRSLFLVASSASLTHGNFHQTTNWMQEFTR